MLFFLIALVPPAIFGDYLIRKRRREHNRPYGPWTSKGDIAFYSGLALVLSTLVSFFAVWGLSAWIDGHSEEVTGEGQARIVQLNDSVGSGGKFSGSFFLGIGSVSGEFGQELAYSWYERLPGGDLQGRVVTDDGENEVFVRERDGVVPHYRYIDRKDPCHSPMWVSVFDICDPTYYQREWIVVVPKGTVAHGFTLNGASG